MIDSVSLRSAALGVLEARKPVAADISGPANRLSGSDAAATAAKGETAITGNVARTLAQSAPVDTGRVAELRQALKAGNYPVQPERLADAMLASLKA